MPCLLGCLALLTPRIVLVLVFLFSDYLAQAYDTWIWPLLGFIFFPLTTLAYAFAVNQTGGNVSGVYVIILVVAVLVDLSMLGGGGHLGRRRYRTIRR
jgi:hypothetical protein